MNNHIKHLLSSYVDGELSIEEMKEVENHLVICQDCEEERVQLLQIKEELKNAYSMIEIPDFHFEESIMKELASHRTVENHHLQLFKWIGVFALIAMAFLVISLGPAFYASIHIASIFLSIGVKLLHASIAIIKTVPYLLEVALGVLIFVIAISGVSIRYVLERKTVS